MTNLFVFVWPIQGQDAASKPPVAATKPYQFDFHGKKIADPYYWLKDKKNAEVIKYIEAENKYREEMTQSLKPFEEIEQIGHDLFWLDDRQVVGGQEADHSPLSQVRAQGQCSRFGDGPIGARNSQVGRESRRPALVRRSRFELVPGMDFNLPLEQQAVDFQLCEKRVLPTDHIQGAASVQKARQEPPGCVGPPNTFAAAADRNPFAQERRDGVVAAPHVRRRVSRLGIDVHAMCQAARRGFANAGQKGFTIGQRATSLFKQEDAAYMRYYVRTLYDPRSVMTHSILTRSASEGML